MNAISKAVITEKSIRLTESGQYSFVVDINASKGMVAKEIKRLFKVDPISINTITIKGKVKSRGRVVGQRKSIKKAIVRLKNGQKIAEFNMSET